MLCSVSLSWVSNFAPHAAQVNSFLPHSFIDSKHIFRYIMQRFWKATEGYFTGTRKAPRLDCLR